MKILLANKFFFLNGGCERVFFQEREFLIRNGIKVLDFSMHDQRNFPSDYADCFVSRVDYHAPQDIFRRVKQAAKFIHSPEATHKLEELLRSEKPDIAHLHNIYHQLTPSIIHVLKRYGVKIVLTLHDGKLICPAYVMLNRGRICTQCADGSFWKPAVTNCQGSRARGILFSLEAYWHRWARSYENVDLFLSPSRFLMELMSRRIPPNKIRLLRNGVETDVYSPMGKDKGHILYFGRLSREKGIETLLKAHAKLLAPMPLKILGTGPQEKELRARYPHAHFLGYREPDALREVVGTASFIVVPSEWYENFSMVVLEAMAMGKAVIGARTGGIPEQIDHGKTGLLFTMGDVDDLADKMTFLAKHQELRRKMGEEARRKAEEEYSIDVHCAKLMDVYADLLRGPQNPAEDSASGSGGVPASSSL